VICRASFFAVLTAQVAARRRLVMTTDYSF
jgi:hypothetical protein